MVEWWSGGVVEWWSGGVVEWWSGGVVEWWSGGVVEWLSGEKFKSSNKNNVYYHIHYYENIVYSSFTVQRETLTLIPEFLIFVI